MKTLFVEIFGRAKARARKSQDQRKAGKRKKEARKVSFSFNSKTTETFDFRERQAVPAAFLDAAAPDVKKVKLDRRKNGELKDYERLVMERDDSRFLEIPNVLHEF